MAGPVAFNQQVNTTTGTPVAFGLSATDGGIGVSLEFVAVTLPANGTIYDINSGSPITVGHVYPSGSWRYIPNPGFSGTDSFEWYATESQFDILTEAGDLLLSETGWGTLEEDAP